MEKSIELVDDAEGTLQELAEIVSQRGYRPIGVTPAQDPINAFGDSEPELVFISLKRPDAEACCDAMRNHPAGAIVPIIFIGTGEQTIRSAADALRHGGDFYFSHPFDPPTVLAKVQTYIGPAAPKETSSPSHAPSPKSHAIEPLPSFNWSAPDTLGDGAASRARIDASDKLLEEILRAEEAEKNTEHSDKPTVAEAGVPHEAQVPTPASSQPAPAQVQEPPKRDGPPSQPEAGPKPAPSPELATPKRDDDDAGATTKAAAVAETPEPNAAPTAPETNREEPTKFAAETQQRAQPRIEKPRDIKASAAPAGGAAKPAPQRQAHTAPRDGKTPEARPPEVHPKKRHGGGRQPTETQPLTPAEGAITPLFDIASLFFEIFRQRTTGRIDISTQQQQKSIFAENGVPVGALSSQTYDRIEEYLYREGRITRAQYQAVRVKRFRNPRRLGAFLLTENYIKSHELFDAVRGHFKETLYGLFEVDHGTYRYVPELAAEDDRVALDSDPRTLIAEGVRRKYLMPRLTKRLGAPSSLIAAKGEDPAAMTRDLDFSKEERHILRLVDGTRSIEDIIFSTGSDPLRVYQLLASLCAMGYLEVLVRGIEGLGESGDASEDSIDRARIREKTTAVRQLDYFQILGVSTNATPYEIQRACERIHREFDPMRFLEATRREFKEQLEEIHEVVGDAQDVLTDDALRHAYSLRLG